ncbi:MAG: hypothetical protein AAGB02_08360 [Pseudomonadota bacterium]
MAAKIIFPFVILASAALGGGGGYLLKNKSSAAEAETKVEKDEKPKKQGKKGKGKSAGVASPVVYMKFSRQFVVPIIKNGRPAMMMIFDINIVLDDATAEGAYGYEPLLRDAMLADLLRMASEGILTKSTEDQSAMKIVKERLLTIAQEKLGEGASDILLLDVGLQPY